MDIIGSISRKLENTVFLHCELNNKIYFFLFFQSVNGVEKFILMFSSTCQSEQPFSLTDSNTPAVRSRLPDTRLNSVLKAVSSNKISPEIQKTGQISQTSNMDFIKCMIFL